MTSAPFLRLAARLALALPLVGAGTAALAQTAAKPQPGAKPAAAKPAGPGGHQATLLGTFGDWGAYTTQTGRAKLCYALSQPKDRLPKTLTRDPGYLFVSFRPAENVKNEVAVVMGFPTQDNGEASATIGNESFAFVTKGENAWIKNPAEEGQLVASLARGSALVLKVKSKRGNETTDRYSLSGFSAALDRVRKECP